MNIYESVTELIGGTPLLHISRFEQKQGLKARLFAKLEGMNPAGSAKDRVGLNLILDAEKRGLLKEGAAIIAPYRAENWNVLTQADYDAISAKAVALHDALPTEVSGVNGAPLDIYKYVNLTYFEQ